MPIDTTNEKLAIMEIDRVWEPGLPISPGVFDQGEQQQLLWGYPGVLWAELAQAPVLIATPGDPPTSAALVASKTTGVPVVSKTTAVIIASKTTGE